MNSNKITLGHGAGGLMSQELLQQCFLPRFGNPILNRLADGASLRLPGGEELVFSTDSFVISPRFFPGGDIGKLAVCGTVNDLAVCGAKPLWLSCSFIIEDGFSMEELDAICDSMARTASRAGVQIVTGDTKVVEKGEADGIYINTAGIGTSLAALRPETLESGDAVLISGTVGDHGMTIAALRKELEIHCSLTSDCAPLNDMTQALLENCSSVKFMRDPTRGGLASALNEVIAPTKLGILLEESAVPVRRETQALCEMLGFDPLYVPNEGKIVVILSSGEQEKALEIMKSFKKGENAAVIGKISENYGGRVVAETPFGSRRIVDMISGVQLPRIC